MKEFTTNMSHRMEAFLHPIRETSSVVCWGVKASIFSVSGWYIDRMSEAVGG